MDNAWRKSTKSGDTNCVEIKYSKSTKSSPSGDNCVEVGIGGECGMIHVRDSKLGDASPVLTFTTSEWDAFLGGAKGNEFDL